MLPISVLPAKSPDSTGQSLGLHAHLCDTDDAAVQLMSGRWGARFTEMFGVRSTVFMRHLRVAALLHDIGKANTDFVAAVTRGARQSIRHEHLSALVAFFWREWFESAGLDADAIIAAVLSHHFKASDGADAADIYGWGCRRETGAAETYFDHSDVTAIIARVERIVGGSAPLLPLDPWRHGSGTWFDLLQRAKRHAVFFEEDVIDDPVRARFTAALKVGVVCADVVASGITARGMATDEWLTSIVNKPPLHGDDIVRHMIEPRLGGRPRRTFQQPRAIPHTRAAIMAGCGSGKTIAALQWAADQLSDVPRGSLVFLYPTRGTATEGWADYARDVDGSFLHHGTADLAVERLYDGGDTDAPDRGVRETMETLRALALWDRRCVFATADRFLSLMSHRRESFVLTPLLADSVVVIDEIHSFDTAMWRALLEFLRHFNLPVLLLSATITTTRREELQALGVPVIQPGGESGTPSSRTPRYRFASASDDVVLDVIERASSGEKVLWVHNTVSMCQDRARTITAAGGRCHVYHSRFRACDRVERHREIMDAFRRPGGTIIVTTQVCEMSLDVSADVLFTDECPIPALIQRMGRVNRYGIPETPSDVVVLPVESPVPYDDQSLTACRELVRATNGTIVSRDDMTVLLDRHQPKDAFAASHCDLMTSGFYARPGRFRDDGYTVGAVLTTDIARCTAASSTHELRRLLKTLEVPVLRRDVCPERPDWLPRWMGAADGSMYDPVLGFVANRT
jgi:CRISPR-associated endonuclease/helicase Cas3